MKSWLMIIFLTLGTNWVDAQDTVCEREDLEICTHKFQRLEILDDIFDGTQLCEVRIETRDCFVNYTEVCVDGEAEEVIEQEYVQGLQTNITEECMVFTVSNEEVRQEFECLGNVENHAEDCAIEVAASVFLLHMTSDNPDSLKESEMKCLVVDGMISCICERVRACSSDELADAVREGIREELKEVIDACARGEDPSSILESEEP